MPLQIGKIGSWVIRDRVLDAFENALTSSALRPGDRVVESEIAREAGISLTDYEIESVIVYVRPCGGRLDTINFRGLACPRLVDVEDGRCL